MSRNRAVAFGNFSHFPAGHDRRHTTIFLDSRYHHFSNQFPAAINQQFASFQYSLLFTCIQNDELPLGIKSQHLAVESGRQFDLGTVSPCDFLEDRYLLVEKSILSLRNPQVLLKFSNQLGSPDNLL